MKKSVVEVLGCEALDLNLPPEEILNSFSESELLEKHKPADTDRGYERTVLFKNKDYELVFCHWRNGDKSAVHNHPNQRCWFKCIKGQMLELRSMGQEQNYLQEGESGYIDDSMGAHQMLNLSGESAYSLHVYQTVNQKP